MIVEFIMKKLLWYSFTIFCAVSISWKCQNTLRCSKKCFTAQKMKFFIKDFSSKCDQIHRKLRIWSHLLEKPLMENLIFCSVGCSVKFSLVLGKILVTVPSVNIVQKQFPRRVLTKKYSENMLQIYMRKRIKNCDFNKVAKELY